MTEMSPDTSSETDRLEHFAANVAHDFNNLLTGILGNLELLQNRAERSGVTYFDGYLEGARNASSRAATFAQRLLVFSSRATRQDFVTVAIEPLIREIAESMHEHRSNLSVDLTAGPAKVLCDPEQAELALHELLNNAADATKASGAILLKTEISSGFVTILISDTGTGMTPEILARAREPFFTSRPNGAGKGLGLAIADGFARQAGGSLEIASEPGHGTTVSLRLPMIEA